MDKKIFLLNLGPIEQVPLGQGSCFSFRGHDIAVFRSRKGNFYAVENRCPHRGGPLSEGVMDENKIVCPLHAHKFDLATGQGQEKHECVLTFRVRVRDGELILDYPASLIKPNSEEQECQSTSYGKGNLND